MNVNEQVMTSQCTHIRRNTALPLCYLINIATQIRKALQRVHLPKNTEQSAQDPITAGGWGLATGREKSFPP